jgi:hypothetical protein
MYSACARSSLCGGVVFSVGVGAALWAFPCPPLRAVPPDHGDEAGNAESLGELVLVHVGPSGGDRVTWG